MTLLKPILAILLVSFVFICGYSQTPNQSSTNKQLVQKVFDELINKKKLEIFDQFFATDVIDHSAFPGQQAGLEGLRKSVEGLFENYPDIQVKIEEIIAEGDFVVTRDAWSATEKSTGKKKSGWVMHMIKIKGGKITEEWSKGWEWLD